MNYYKLLKINSIIKNPRIKFLGLLVMHILKKRYISVQFDPVNACNLRCKMCYFTDKDYVKKLKGVFKPEELPLFSKAVLSRAMKLQIGCGTEPTLYKNLDDIFEEAAKAKVPYISMTTNANLLTEEKVEKWAILGLNEITVSLHGVYKETYENMMGKGDFNLFKNALKAITIVKQKYPQLKLRVNYTFNEDNFNELKEFWNVFAHIHVDYLQIRPIKKIGETEYNNFSLDKIIPIYSETYEVLQKKALENNTTFLAPKIEHLQQKESINSVIQPFTYCYISPTHFWKNDFNWKEETFDHYAKRKGLVKELISLFFASKKHILSLQNKTLNYDIN